MRLILRFIVACLLLLPPLCCCEDRAGVYSAAVAGVGCEGHILVMWHLQLARVYSLAKLYMNTLAAVLTDVYLDGVSGPRKGASQSLIVPTSILPGQFRLALSWLCIRGASCDLALKLKTDLPWGTC